MLGKVQEVERKAITFRRDITPGSLYRLLLARFKRLCDESGMEFSVLWIPSRKNPQENMPQMEVECARIGCRFVDGNRVWEELSVDHRVAYQPDNHPDKPLLVGLGSLLASRLKSA